MEELKWLSDPSKLARRVAQILANGEPAKAAAIVREAPKQHIKSVVAWGHLLDYCLERGHTHAAFRFYNDVSAFLFLSSVLILLVECSPLTRFVHAELTFFSGR